MDAGYFRLGPLPGTPILRVLHSDNVVWAVSVARPEVWEASIRALASNMHLERSVPRQSKGFRLIAGFVLLIVLLLSVAIPVVTSLTHLNSPQQEMSD